MAEEHREEAVALGSGEPFIGPKMGASLGTAAAVGLGVALIEEELIAGVLIGVGAALAPQLMGNIGRALRPVVKGAVKAGYTVYNSARETVAEATEQMEDIVAEVKADSRNAPGEATDDGKQRPRGQKRRRNQ